MLQTPQSKEVSVMMLSRPSCSLSLGLFPLSLHVQLGSFELEAMPFAPSLYVALPLVGELHAARGAGMTWNRWGS
jgi:hypothetical protein